MIHNYFIPCMGSKIKKCHSTLPTDELISGKKRDVINPSQNGLVVGSGEYPGRKKLYILQYESDCTPNTLIAGCKAE